MRLLRAAPQCYSIHIPIRVGYLFYSLLAATWLV